MFVDNALMTESDEARAQARADANDAAELGDWLSLVLDHHVALEEALAEVENAKAADERADAFKDFAVLLTGHAIAEEAVLYPALSANAQTGHASTGYGEQAMFKIQMAALEKLDPGSAKFRDKLAYVKNALLHHMYQEESSWFLELKSIATADEQEIMTDRYREEFERYTGEPVQDDEDERGGSIRF